MAKVILMTCKLTPPKQLIKVFESCVTDEVEAFKQMLDDPNWINAPTFRDQCKVLINYIHNESIGVHFAKLGQLFGNKHCVQKQYYKIIKEDSIKSPGRPKLLTPSQHNELEKVIQYYHDNHQYTKYDEIAEFIFERFSISIDIESCRKYIQNNCHFDTAIGVPLDRNRLNGSEDDIDIYYDLLEADVTRVNPSFIYNLDEVGFQDFVDSKSVTVIVPENFPSEKVNISCDRNEKRCSALVSISLDGENVPPTLILPRLTIDSEVYSVLPKNCFKAFSKKMDSLQQQYS